MFNWLSYTFSQCVSSLQAIQIMDYDVFGILFCIVVFCIIVDQIL